jgi:hypothetical protein
MNIRTFRSRVAVRYCCTAAVFSALASTGSWFAIRSELNHAPDLRLRCRQMGLREFPGDLEPGGGEEVASAPGEISLAGQSVPQRGEVI